MNNFPPSEILKGVIIFQIKKLQTGYCNLDERFIKLIDFGRNLLRRISMSAFDMGNFKS